jgi:membrane protease YdiL (CAAX protease family)
MTPLSRNDFGDEALDRRSGVAVVLTVLIAFLVGEVVAGIFVSVGAALCGYHGGLIAISKSAHPPAWSTLATLAGLWVGYVGGFFVMRRISPSAPFASLFRVKWSDATYVVVGVVMQLAVVLAYAPFHLRHFSKPTDKLFSGTSGLGFVVLCVVTATVVPILEELFFRATLLPGLIGLFGSPSRRLTTIAAIVVDGTLFALAHGELAQFVGLAFVGMVFAYLFVRSGRLAPSALAHMAFNATALVSVIAHRIT